MIKYASTDSVVMDTQLCEYTKSLGEVYTLNGGITWCVNYVSVIKSDPNILEDGKTAEES